MDTTTRREFGGKSAFWAVDGPPCLRIRDLASGSERFVDGSAQGIGLRKTPNLLDQFKYTAMRLR